MHAYSPPLTAMSYYAVDPTGDLRRTRTVLTDRRGSMTTVDDLLAAARARLDRVGPARAAELAADGAQLVDTRPQWQRDDEGTLPGALLIERNHLEWRLDPTSDARIPQATDHDVTWIVVCSEGYSSSLAAASLQDLGLRNATDLDGGFRAWKAAGLAGRAEAPRSTGRDVQAQGRIHLGHEHRRVRRRDVARIRSTATDRTCSACTLESRGRPLSPAGRNTWNV